MGIQAILDPIIAGIGSVGTAAAGALGTAATDLGLGGAAAGAGAAGAGAAAAGGGDLAGVLGTIGAQNVATDATLAAAAPGLDAAATGAGLSAADIGGSFASLAATPAADFLTGAGAASGASALGGTSAAPAAGGAASGAAPGAAAGGATVGPSGAATGGAAGGLGGAAGGAAPASAASGGLSAGDITSAGSGGIGSDAVAGGTAGAAPGTSATSALSAGAPGAAGAASPAASAVTGGAAGAAAPAASGGLNLGALGGKLLSNPGALISGGGLLYNLLQGDKKPANYGALEAQAQQAGSQGQILQSYLTSGTLPPGIASGLQQAHQAAEATIRGNYASRGQTGSSAEAQDLSNLANTTMANGAQIATQLLGQGISESQLSSNIYQQLMNEQINQDNQLSSSIANFAGSLAGFKPAVATTQPQPTPVA